MATSSGVSEVRIDTVTPEGAELREIRALKVVRNYSLLAGAVGVIPLPVVDAALAVVVSVRMLQKLADQYGYAFESRQRIYAIIGSLFGGAALPLLISPAIFSLLKLIPVVGTVAGIVAMPIGLSTSSYALGRTFIQHFEAGGTLLSFDPAQMRNVLKAYHQKGTGAAIPSGAGVGQSSDAPVAVASS